MHRSVVLPAKAAPLGWRDSCRASAVRNTCIPGRQEHQEYESSCPQARHVQPPFRARRNGMAIVKFSKLPRKTIIGDALIEPALATEYQASFGIAQARRRFHQGVEYGPQIES